MFGPGALLQDVSPKGPFGNVEGAAPHTCTVDALFEAFTDGPGDVQLDSWNGPVLNAP